VTALGLEPAVGVDVGVGVVEERVLPLVLIGGETDDACRLGEDV
jgi:hypothetical protein